MSEVFICTSCYVTEGADDGGDYCDFCESYKYFAWVESDDDDDYL
jgi:hypothetical protein